MDKLEKKIDIWIKEKEYSGTPYIIPGLGKREWPGFKSVGSVFFIDINIKNKKIFFYLDCEFKMKPYFRFDQVSSLKYIKKEKVDDYVFDISNVIPFYYISFTKFNTTTMRAFWRNKKINELQARSVPSFNFEKLLVMNALKLDDNIVEHILKILSSMYSFKVTKRSEKIKKKLEDRLKLWKFKNIILFKNSLITKDKQKKIVLIKFIRRYLVKSKNNLRKRLENKKKNKLPPLHEGEKGLSKEEKALVEKQKALVEEEKALALVEEEKELALLQQEKELSKWQKRRLNKKIRAKKLNLAKMENELAQEKKALSEKGLIKWQERELAGLSKEEKQLNDEKLFNISEIKGNFNMSKKEKKFLIRLENKRVTRILNLIDNSSDEEIARIICNNRFIFYHNFFDKKGAKLYKKVIKKFINIENQMEFGRFTSMIFYSQIFKAYAYEMYKKFMKKKYRVVGYTNYTNNENLRFIKLEVLKKNVRIVKDTNNNGVKKKFIFRKNKSKIWNSIWLINPSYFIKKSKNNLRKVLSVLIKKRKFIRDKKIKLYIKNKAYWLKKQHNPKQAIYNERLKRRRLKEDYEKKRKIQLSLVSSKKEIISKIDKKPSFYTWVLGYLLDYGQGDTVLNDHLQRKGEVTKGKRLKWIQSQQRQRNLTKLKKIELMLKLINEEEPASLELLLKSKRRKYIRIRDTNKKRQRIKIKPSDSQLKFQEILKKKKYTRMSNSRMYPSPSWREGIEWRKN